MKKVQQHPLASPYEVGRTEEDLCHAIEKFYPLETLPEENCYDVSIRLLKTLYAEKEFAAMPGALRTQTAEFIHQERLKEMKKIKKIQSNEKVIWIVISVMIGILTAYFYNLLLTDNL